MGVGCRLVEEPKQNDEKLVNPPSHVFGEQRPLNRSP